MSVDLSVIFLEVFVFHIDGVGLRLWTEAFNGPIVHLPDGIWVWTATVEWYWPEKTKELGEKPVPVLLCPPQIPHGVNRARTLPSAVICRRLSSWAMARTITCRNLLSRTLDYSKLSDCIHFLKLDSFTVCKILETDCFPSLFARADLVACLRGGWVGGCYQIKRHASVTEMCRFCKEELRAVHRLEAVVSNQRIWRHKVKALLVWPAAYCLSPANTHVVLKQKFLLLSSYMLATVRRSRVDPCGV
jgi:hypothetical protein